MHWAISKRFEIIMGTVAALWVIWWGMVGPYFSGKIELARKQAVTYSNYVRDLAQENAALGEDDALELERSCKLGRQQVSVLLQRVLYEPTEKYDGNVAVFRAQVDKKSAELQMKANRIGIEIGDNLGFPQSLDANFHAGCWTALETGCQLLQLLITLNSQERQVYHKIQLAYPTLAALATQPDSFIAEIPVEISLQARHDFIMKLVYHASLLPGVPENAARGFFYKIKNVSLEALPDGSGLLKAKILLAALQIRPQAAVTALPTTSPTNQPTKPKPVWEEY